jgi:hypothetical protein
MLDSLRNETVVRKRAPIGLSPPQSGGVSVAIAQTLAKEDREFAHRRWSEALGRNQRPRFGGLHYGRRLVTSRAVCVGRGGTDAFRPIERIGGKTGWYAVNWFWSLRGLLDRLGGGVGRRRGRRDPERLLTGDALDFWRVESVQSGRLLRLSAEMKMPGRLWLQFEVDGTEQRTALRQTTIFDPAGYVGRAYWYLSIRCIAGCLGACSAASREPRIVNCVRRTRHELQSGSAKRTTRTSAGPGGFS